MEDTNSTNNMGGYPSGMPAKKSKKTVLLWTIVAVLALAAGGVGGYVWGQMGKQHEVNQAKEAAKKEAKKSSSQQAADTSTTDRQQASAPAKIVTEPTCNADELSLEAAQGSDSGAGTLAYDLTLTNTGDRTCTLGGFPGVSLVNANGNMVGQPADRATNYAEKKLSLTPGMKVKATLSAENSSNFDAGQCKSGATKLRMYPPNDTGYLSVASPLDTWCPKMMISPVLAM